RSRGSIPQFDPRLETAFFTYAALAASPYMGTSKSSAEFQQQIFFSIRLFDPLRSILSSRPASSHGRRAQGRSRMAVAPRRPCANAFPGHSLTAPSTAARSGRVGIKPEPGVRPADLYNEHNTIRGGARLQWPAIVATYLHAADQTRRCSSGGRLSA